MNTKATTPRFLLVATTLLLAPLGAHAAVGGLQFDGSNDHVSFGAAPSLGVTNFTIECWFKRTGAGAAVSTGTGGITAVPLVTKGRGEADGSNLDMNWFLGFTSAGVLTADFEDRNSGLNHPVAGTAVVGSNVWQHAAVTYQQDGTNGTWVLYLNGSPDKTNTFTGANINVTTPRGDSLQRAALASALTSAGTAGGFFAGLMDEVRVWSIARNASDIAASYNTQITNATGLIARWSLDEGTGTTISNSVSGGVNGTLLNGPVWSDGYFVIASPAQVSLTSPANGSTVIGNWVTLSATASPSTGASVTNVEFYADAAKIGEDAAAPYTVNWCDVAPASYALTAVVKDDSGASATSSVVNVTLSAPAATGSLQFDGSNDYVTFGTAPELGLSTFTIECWFKRTGTGQTTTTGTGGVTDAIPLVTKGRGEAEGSNVDMNWFLGISTGGNVLAADFEEGAVGASPGLNHPVRGNTALANGVWYHAAATYDGANWVLFLNGVSETNVAVGQPPRSDSIQHAALASALTSAGAAQGYFAGLLDEVRVWNYARSATEIADNYNLQLTNQTGLIARWAVNEAAGTEARNTLCGGINGTLLNDPAWSTDHFAANSPPAVAITNPPANAVFTLSPLTIEASASDTGGSVTNVEFYADGAKVGEDDTVPYAASWGVSQEGLHTLLAVATDNLGAQATSAVVTVTYVAGGAGGLYFDGANDYVTFGSSPELGLTNFTLECWFKRLGPGVTASTGGGGVNAYPLVTKGRGETDNSNNVDMAWFLGLNSSGQLVADFEDWNSGLNHPVIGTASVASNVWQHAAVTYDQPSGQWVLYLNGQPDATNVIVGADLVRTPRADSIQHAALASALRSSGAPEGYFAGALDEVRVWNYARTGEEIAANYLAQIPGDTGLLARWALEDGAGLAATNSGLSTVAGILTNGPLWVAGYEFPPAPTITTDPASTNVNCGDTATFTVTASGPGTLEYQWYVGDVLMSGETNASLIIVEVTSANAGSYKVRVRNTGGPVTSAPALLTVSDTTAPVITACATNMMLSADTNCQVAIPDLTTQVTAGDACGGPVTIIQSPLAGTLVGVGDTVVTLTASDAATNQATCQATLTVVDGAVPLITAQPLSATNLVGTTATFTVTASSCSALGYQWLFGTNVLFGETGSSLVLTNLQTSQSGDYTVVLTNTGGTVTSDVAILTVVLPDAPTLSSGPVLLPNGHFVAEFTGTPGVAYTIEYAEAVTGTWQPLTNLTSDVNGLIEFDDVPVDPPGIRFYRIVYP